MNCALTEVPCIAPEKVRILMWSGLCIYSALLLAGYCAIMITFPGFTSPNFTDWYFNTNNPAYNATQAIWLAMNAISLFVTAFAVTKIFRTAQ